MRTVDDPLAGGDFLHTIDENRPFGLEFLDHEAVVDDLLAHIDRWAESLQGNTNDIDGSHHPSTEPPRL